MRKSYLHLQRLLASLIVILLMSGTTHWPNAFERSCAASCPPTCPMHAKKLRCHEAKGVSCHKTRAPGVSLSAPGCKNHQAGNDLTQLLALPSAELALPESRSTWLRYNVAFRSCQNILEPPFHPPRSV